MTAYSDDTSAPGAADLDAFGVPRRVISTLSANLPSYSDIDGTGGGPTNVYVRLSDAGSLSAIYGGSFETKYSANGLKQIIANIMAYQIDPNAVWPPTDATVNATVPLTLSAPPTYLGLAKTPYINEVRVRYDIVGTGPDFTIQRTVQVELFYIYDNAYVPYTPSGDQITVSGLPPVLGLPTTATVPVPGGQFGTGEYRQCNGPTETAPAVLTAPNIAPLPSNTLEAIYTRSYSGNEHLLDYASMAISAEQLDSGSVVTPVYQGAYVNGDPALNEQNGQWTPYPALFSGTYGSDNLNLPPDVSKVVIRGAAMQSIGELGYIHRPEPWNHLTLQPLPAADAGKIPDWAMLDLFTVGSATKGRININSYINPGATGPTQPRLVPLKALLNSVGLSGSATTVYDDSNASRLDPINNPSGDDPFGMKDLTSNLPVFDTIGEVCEIPALAAGADEAAKEAAIRRIANLITVRSNTFKIWVIAQSIKDRTDVGTVGTYDPPDPLTGAARDLITGEVRAQAVVERYEQGGQVKFRILYFRYL
jgi:hypothetical protein